MKTFQGAGICLCPFILNIEGTTAKMKQVNKTRERGLHYA